MRYATYGHSAELTGKSSHWTPYGVLKISYQGPMGEFTPSELDRMPAEWREFGWSITIGQFVDGEWVESPFLGLESIRNNKWFKLSFSLGGVRMSTDVDRFD